MNLGYARSRRKVPWLECSFQGVETSHRCALNDSCPAFAQVLVCMINILQQFLMGSYFQDYYKRHCNFLLGHCLSFSWIPCSGENHAVSRSWRFSCEKELKIPANSHVSELWVNPSVPNKSSEIATLANILTETSLKTNQNG